MNSDAPSSLPDIAPASAPRVDSWLDRILTALGLKASATIREDLEDALHLREGAQSFTPQERAMLRNILGIRSVKVKDVMVPRAEIIAVPADITLADLLRVFRTQGHSRLPAYGETLDDPRGMVHIRDFLDYLSTRAESGAGRGRRKREGASVLDLGQVDLSATLQSARLLRPVLYAPPSMPAMDLLLRMQSTRTHMALIVDEYGGTDGLVSIEDLVEMIVGDIEDEHDDEGSERITTQPDGSLVVDARSALEQVAAALGVSFDNDPAAADVDTIGGLLVTVAQRVPARGELISLDPGLEIEILDADPRRIKRVRIHRRRSASDPVATTDPTIEDADIKPQAPAPSAVAAPPKAEPGA
jgi:CBS domain containing-hemolysin-like protein